MDDASIAQLLLDVRYARQGYATACKFTPFSNWYKGNHGKCRTALLRALAALCKALPKGEPLLVAVQVYRDSVLAKATPDGSALDAAIEEYLARSSV